jgi:Mn-dependent DtxR family transcriptional regulator
VSEAEVRKQLLSLGNDKYIIINKGRGGSSLTEKGREYLANNRNQ